MFKNMKIGLRLALGFGLVLVFMITLILLSFNAMDKIYAALEVIVKNENVRSRLANNMVDDTREVSIALRNIFLDHSRTEEMEKRIYEIRENYDADFKKFEELVGKDETKTLELISKIKVGRDESRALNNQAFELGMAGKYKDATDLILNKARLCVRQWITDTDNLIKSEDEHTLLRYDEAQKQYDSTSKLMAIMSAAAIVFSVVIVIFLTLSITRPLRISVDAANRIAAKDLTVDISTSEKRGDELGVLIQSFSIMLESLRAQMKGIMDGVNILASSSSEILASTTQIASGSAETATSISETSTTVEEVRQAAQLSSEKARNVSDTMQRTAQVTQTGQKAVEETVSGMNHIRNQMESIANTIVNLSEQSQLIGGIIASVNDIADQSNLLAVNAAIEASKAGESGKGFTVVAQEIKSLAEQSKKATAQVRNILSDIQKATSAAVMATEQGSKAVETGVKQSTQAGETIRVLSESSDEALQAATQIAASSQQQLVGMNQIGLAMENINQAGVENAASMKQSENTAKDLNELGLKLKQMVEQYKL
ncbi:MAG TPA: methyl-accepting chemotaxis protein [Anaerolineae bacterium]|nr:methyl-accepting chemotaxis protein [Anaerolineae bacterium]